MPNRCWQHCKNCAVQQLPDEIIPGCTKQFPRRNKPPSLKKPILGKEAHSGNRENETGRPMTSPQKPITIKKYANRRLYNTGTSTYVTLEDLATMVKKGEDFAVFDAKSNEDITRSVLAQIIFEQENKDGQSLLPVAFLRQLIGFYGDSMQGLVPSFLELSMERFTGEQQNFRDHAAKAFGTPPFPAQAFGSMDELARQNMAMFTNAMAMFNPFAKKQPAAVAENAPTPAPADFDAMKQQLNDMQKRIEEMAKKR